MDRAGIAYEDVYVLRERKGHSDAYEKSLKALGTAYRVLFVPVLRVSPVEELQTMALPDPSQFDSIVVTSSRALQVLDDERSQWLQACKDSLLYVVGAATKETALRKGFVDIVSNAAEQSRAAALAAMMLKQQPQPRNVLFLCGDPHRTELVKELKAADVNVTELVVYRSVEASNLKDKIDGSRPAFAVFFSPAGAMYDLKFIFFS